MSVQSERPGTGPERIEVARSEDPRDAVHRAVECLAKDGIVELPTGTGYALAARGLSPETVARLGRAIGAPSGPFASISIGGMEEARDWVSPLPGLTERVLRRSWPGPVRARIALGAGPSLSEALDSVVRDAVSDGKYVQLSCEPHPMLRSVRDLMAGPLLIAERWDVGSESNRPVSGSEIDLILDAGADATGAGASIIRFDPEQPTMEREGEVSRAELKKRSGKYIIIICTGNTCRSPMAEAILKAILAKRVGCEPTVLDQHGFVVRSAGLNAMAGMPAARNAVEAVKEFGGCLTRHQSQPVTEELVEESDLILTMTQDHLDTLLHYWPQAEGRARLLDPSGMDVQDPIGSDLSNYRNTAREIDEHLSRWVSMLGV